MEPKEIRPPASSVAEASVASSVASAGGGLYVASEYDFQHGTAFFHHCSAKEDGWQLRHCGPGLLRINCHKF